MPFLEWPLIWHKGILGKTWSAAKQNLKSLKFPLYSSGTLIQRVYLLHVFHLKLLPFHFLWISLLFCLQFSTVTHAQDLTQIDEDPYLDPDSASEVLQPAKRTESAQAYLFGISYGLNPIVILAPAISLGMYWDPLVFGMEISDSEHLGIWEKERRENFGTSRFRGDTQFIKWFYGDNFYLIAAREHRIVNLWNRTYNRLSGHALFDMHIETTLTSLGAGLLRFNDIGFLAIDVLRFNVQKKESVKVVEYWETWSTRSGTREDLDENIQKRSDKWVDILDSPSGFIFTFGFYF